jgi:hypothetical protein
LQHRMLADRMMRGEEGSEFEAGHGVSLRKYCFVYAGLGPNYGLGETMAMLRRPLPMHGCRAGWGGFPSPGICWRAVVGAGDSHTVRIGAKRYRRWADPLDGQMPTTVGMRDSGYSITFPVHGFPFNANLTRGGIFLLIGIPEVFCFRAIGAVLCKGSLD